MLHLFLWLSYAHSLLLVHTKYAIKPGSLSLTAALIKPLASSAEYGETTCGTTKSDNTTVSTVEPHYNEVSQYPKNCSL